jgi:hypothetical protein
MVAITTGYTNSQDALKTYSDYVGTVNPETGKGTGMLGGIATAYNNMEKQVNENLKNIGTAMGMEQGASLNIKNFATVAKDYLVGKEGDK